MDNVIGIVWVIGFLIGCIITAWNMGRQKAEYPNIDISFCTVIFIVVSIFWPIILTLVCILCPFWLIGRYSQHHHEKKIQKSEEST